MEGVLTSNLIQKKESKREREREGEGEVVKSTVDNMHNVYLGILLMHKFLPLQIKIFW